MEIAQLMKWRQLSQQIPQALAPFHLQAENIFEQNPSGFLRNRFTESLSKKGILRNRYLNYDSMGGLDNISRKIFVHAIFSFPSRIRCDRTSDRRSMFRICVSSGRSAAYEGMMRPTNEPSLADQAEGEFDGHTMPEEGSTETKCRLSIILRRRLQKGSAIDGKL